MKQFLGVTVLLILMVMQTNCTDQSSARSWGGESTMKVNGKVVTTTWKNADLWILTRVPEPGEKPVKYTFKESSSYGIMEGTVFIQENFTAIKKPKRTQN